MKIKCYFSRNLKSLLCCIALFVCACSDHAEFDINGFRSQAPTRALTNVYTEVQFYFDTDVDAECGGWCDEAPSAVTEFSFDMELTESPSGANIAYILPDFESDETLSYVRSFFFKADTPGTYVFTLTLSGNMTIESNGNSDSDSYTATITVSVEENNDASFLAISEEYTSSTDLDVGLTTISYEYVWTDTSGGLETEAYILSAEDDDVVVFDMDEYDDGDESMMVPTLVVADETYRLPFMVMTMGNGLGTFGQVMFYDHDENDIDEIYFTPYSYSHPASFNGSETVYADWYNIFDPFNDIYAARFEMVP